MVQQLDFEQFWTYKNLKCEILIQLVAAKLGSWEDTLPEIKNRWSMEQGGGPAAHEYHVFSLQFH